MVHQIGREAAVAALKKFARADWHEIDEHIGKNLADETDRGAVILGATAVDDVLQKAILERMVTLNADEEDRLFGPDRPLGSFSARVRMAHALGIIDRDQRKVCDLIREMRNACAHSRRAVSFETPELKNVLVVAARGILPGDVSSATWPMLMRLAFSWICLWLTWSVTSGKQVATEYVNRAVTETLEAMEKGEPSQQTPPEQ